MKRKFEISTTSDGRGGTAFEIYETGTHARHSVAAGLPYSRWVGTYETLRELLEDAEGAGAKVQATDEHWMVDLKALWDSAEGDDPMEKLELVRSHLAHLHQWLTEKRQEALFAAFVEKLRSDADYYAATFSGY